MYVGGAGCAVNEGVKCSVDILQHFLPPEVSMGAQIGQVECLTAHHGLVSQSDTVQLAGCGAGVWLHCTHPQQHTAASPDHCILILCVL